MGCGEFQQVWSATGDELFVGRHHRFAGFEYSPHNLFCRTQSTNQFHHNVGVRAKNRVDIFGPDHFLWNPILPLSLDVAIKDVSELKCAVATLTENLGDGPADGTKSQERDAAGGALPGHLLCITRGLHHSVHRRKLNSL